MITKEMAEILNGMEYGEYISDEDLKYAKDNGAVIVVGASDDLMEFCGAIDDDGVCYEGGIVYFNRSGELRSECDNDGCPYFDAIKTRASTIKAIWDSKGYLWSYETDIPHETFVQYEDGKAYSQGIVFSIDDVVEG